MPAIIPATIKTRYTPAVAARNEPFRFTSSECDPDSTKLSNIFLSSLNGAKRARIQISNQRAIIRSHRSNPLDDKKRKATVRRISYRRHVETRRYGRHK